MKDIHVRVRIATCDRAQNLLKFRRAITVAQIAADRNSSFRGSMSRGGDGVQAAFSVCSLNNPIANELAPCGAVI